MAKKAAASRQRDEVVEPDAVLDPEVEQELGLIRVETDAVQQFLAQARAFVTETRGLARQSVVLLEQAEGLRKTPPTDQASDVAVQAFKKVCDNHAKTIEERWDGTRTEPGITKMLSGLHRYTTQARALGSAPAEQAARIAQSLHNTYAENERRRAEMEQARVREAAERAAREQREAEMAALEAAALAREAASDELSAREQDFVRFMVQGATPEMAASHAGYKAPAVQGGKLMALPKIQVAIESAKEAQLLRQQQEAVRRAPVHVDVAEVAPRIGKAAGVRGDRVTWSADVFDAAALIEGVIAGVVPADAVQVNVVRLNQYAVSLHERLDAWPGVRARKTTTTV